MWCCVVLRAYCVVQVTDYLASIVHPLMKVLDGHSDELRRDATDTMCQLALVQVRCTPGWLQPTRCAIGAPP